ncbi:MAG: hypothetical protein WC889_07475 [Myxococcota bacterium]
MAVAAVPAAASEKEESRYGGFGGPEVRVSSVDGSAMILPGGRGGFIFKWGIHGLALGGGGYGLATERMYTPAGQQKPMRLEFAYGGPIVDYIFTPVDFFSISASLMTGFAVFGLYYESSTQGPAADGFHQSVFCLEPALNLDFKVASFMKIGLSGAWRFFTGFHARGLDANSLAGPSGGVIIKFGKF